MARRLDLERCGENSAQPAFSCGFPLITAPRSPASVSSVATPLQVLIVDDHAVVRSGLRLLLDANEDIDVVGEAGSAQDAVFRARALEPQASLMDVTMPDQSGSEGLPQLLREHPATNGLRLSMHDDPLCGREASRPGAGGSVLKEAGDAEVVAALREVAGGGGY